MSATRSLASTLEPLRMRYLGSPLPGWLDASAAALLSVLPAALRRQVGAADRRLLISLQGNELQLRSWADAQPTMLGVVGVEDPELLQLLRARLDETAPNVPRWLLLGIGQTLRPVLAVPASAEPRLREMMAHEIDRQTPFALDQVSFEPRVLSRDPATRQLRVELVVLPKFRLDAALVALGPLADGLAGVDVVDDAGTALGVNLLPMAGRTLRTDAARLANRWLAAITLVALWATMWLALGNRHEAFEQQSASLAAATTEARQVRRLRGELEGSMRAANFLALQRAQQPTMLELLADLTRRIPDGTYLEKIAVSGGNIVLLGKSSQASSLVRVLQESPLVKRPTLTGSVQRDPRDGRERFTLTAVVAGSQKERESASAATRNR